MVYLRGINVGKYTIVPWILWESEHNLLQKRFICSHLCGGFVEADKKLGGKTPQVNRRTHP